MNHGTLDHVHVAVGDPISYAERLMDRCGLEAVPLTVSSAGIMNWIVPLAPPQHILISAAIREDGHDDVVWYKWLASLDLDVAVPIGWAIDWPIGKEKAEGPDVVPAGVTSLPSGLWRWSARSDLVRGAMGALPILISYERATADRIADLAASFPDLCSDNARTAVAVIAVGADEDRLDPMLAQLPKLEFEVTKLPGPRAIRSVVMQRDGRRFALPLGSLKK